MERRHRIGDRPGLGEREPGLGKILGDLECGWDVLHPEAVPTELPDLLKKLPEVVHLDLGGLALRAKPDDGAELVEGPTPAPPEHEGLDQHHHGVIEGAADLLTEPHELPPGPL